MRPSGRRSARARRRRRPSRRSSDARTAATIRRRPPARRRTSGWAHRDGAGRRPRASTPSGVARREAAPAPPRRGDQGERAAWRARVHHILVIVATSPASEDGCCHPDDPRALSTRSHVSATQIAVPGRIRPRAGDQPPQTWSLRSGHSGSTRSTRLKPGRGQRPDRVAQGPVVLDVGRACRRRRARRTACGRSTGRSATSPAGPGASGKAQRTGWVTEKTQRPPGRSTRATSANTARDVGHERDGAVRRAGEVERRRRRTAARRRRPGRAATAGAQRPARARSMRVAEVERHAVGALARRASGRPGRRPRRPRGPGVRRPDRAARARPRSSPPGPRRGRRRAGRRRGSRRARSAYAAASASHQAREARDRLAVCPGQTRRPGAV